MSYNIPSSISPTADSAQTNSAVENPKQGALETLEQESMRLTLSDPRLAVPYLIEKRGYTVSDNAIIRNAESDTVLREDLLHTLFLDYPKAVAAENKWRKVENAPFEKLNEKLAKQEKEVLPTIPYVRDASDKLLECALKEFLVEQKAAALRMLRARLACKEENLAPLKAFCAAAFGANNPELEVHEAVLAHWMSGVKRKMNGNIKWNCESMLPIIYGPQNVGKSSIIRMLVGPFADYTIYMNLHTLSDERNGRVYQENFINVFDEASSFKKSDADDLKNITTSTLVNYRPMRTNDCERVENRLSFVCSSNVLADTMIKDTTGMRRLYQIEMMQKADFEALNKMDFIGVWQGVDERRTDYLDAVRLKLQEAQAKLVTIDPIEDFVEHNELRPCAAGTKFVTSNVLLDAYKVWATKNGHEFVEQTYLGKLLKKYGITSERKTVKGVRVRGYNVGQRATFYIHDSGKDCQCTTCGPHRDASEPCLTAVSKGGAA